MYPGCLANSIKRSTEWLPEHVLFIIYFVENQVSEGYLYDMTKNLGNGTCHITHMYAVMFAVGNVMLQ